MDVVVHTKEELEQQSKLFTSRLSPGSENATVVAFSGELGAGKTTFVQTIARALGISEPITSPTFVIEKVYELTNQPFARLIHIDAYRLKSAGELASLGFGTLLSDPKNLICIEWAENVKELIPENAIGVSIQVQEDGARTISYA